MSSSPQKSYSAIFQQMLTDLWLSESSAAYFIHVGGTGSGKTFQAVQRLKEAGNGIYLAPLRLLAWEVYEKLISDGVLCSLLTGEEQITTPQAEITSATIEMMDYSRTYDVVIIDEAFMIGDADRGKSWLKAILSSKAKEIHIIINEEALILISRILEITGRLYKIKRYEALQKFELSPNHFAFNKKMPSKGVFVTFSRIDVLIHKMKFEKLDRKVSVLYGNLPPEVKKKQISNFIEGRTDVLVCTDVIGMGINVPCDYLVFLEVEKFDGKQRRSLKPLEIRQISGRTGRYGLSSQNSFVSSTTENKLSYIHRNFHKEQQITQAYVGFDFEMFSSFPEEMSVYDRIVNFHKLKFIPQKLDELIIKEDIEKYINIYHNVDRNKFDLKIKWALLTAPVKENNKNYFGSLTHTYEKQTVLHPPSTDIEKNVDAKSLEDSISCIELYLNLTRHLIYVQQEKEDSIKTKEKLIEQLTNVFLDKKLSAKKKCKLCTTLLSIDYPYPYCQQCYEDKVCGQYYEPHINY